MSARDLEREYRAMLDARPEYTTQDITERGLDKRGIIKLMETHRPVKFVDYEYGLSYSLKEDERIIVKELNDKSKVREYGKNERHIDYWRCSNQCITSIRCVGTHVKIKDGILFAPINHVKECKPKDLSLIIESQNLLRQGKPNEAIALVSYYNTRLSNSRQPFSESPSSTIDSTDFANISNSENRDLHNSATYSIFSPLPPNPSSSATPVISARRTMKREMDDSDDYCEVIEEHVVKRPRTHPNNNTVYSVCRPSDDVLKQMCEKLKIAYNTGAYKFWGNIALKKLVPSAPSDHIKTYKFRSRNFYACLSLFMTGEMDQCFNIQDTVNNAFRRDLRDSDIEAAEIVELFTSPTVRDVHIEFVAKFLACRIGIYENGSLKKYGNWEVWQKNVLTLILSFTEGEYSVVLDLKL